MHTQLIEVLVQARTQTSCRQRSDRDNYNVFDPPIFLLTETFVITIDLNIKLTLSLPCPAKNVLSCLYASNLSLFQHYFILSSQRERIEQLQTPCTLTEV